MRDSRTKAVSIAAALALTGCGGDARSIGSEPVAEVRIVRVAFPPRQHLAQRTSFVITVRNAGDAMIGDLVVTLSGLTDRAADGTQRLAWIIDDPPPGAVAARDDSRSAGPLAAGDETTLRWRLTAVTAGTHAVSYAVAAGGRGGARALLAGGGAARGTLAVSVDAKPPFARVDPRTGRVIRELTPTFG